MWAEKQKMLNSARITCDFLGLKPGDSALLCMSLDYIAGKMMVVRSIERQLQLISVEPSNHPLAGLEEIPVFAAMVPSQVFCSLQVPEEREKLRRIRYLIIGGGAISKELQQSIANLDSSPRGFCSPENGGTEGGNKTIDREGAFFSSYGMTETLSHIALRSLNGPEKSEWYSPFNSVQFTLNKDHCLVIDAPLVHDGTLVTNDIAEIRSDGCFRIIGRKDNVICSGGIKLQIEEIEEELRTNIRVPYCITKRPDEKFGEVAILLIEKGSEMIDYSIFSNISKYKHPKEIIYVDRIPTTETGKIDRAAAMQLALKQTT